MNALSILPVYFYQSKKKKKIEKNLKTKIQILLDQL